MLQVEWLDRLTIKEVQELQAAELAAAADSPGLGLLLELPCFPHAVLHQQQLTAPSPDPFALNPPPPGASASAAATAAAAQSSSGAAAAVVGRGGRAAVDASAAAVAASSAASMMLVIDPEVGVFAFQ